MTKVGSDKATPILIDGLNIGGYLTDLSDNKQATIEDITCLGDTWQQQGFTGNKQFSVELKGFYDDMGLDPAFAGKESADSILNYSVEGNVVGKRCVGIAGALHASYQRLAAKGAFQKIDVKLTGTGAVDECLTLQALAALSGASGNGSAQDNAASSANGGVMYAQVTALTLGGYTDLKLVVQHSADNSTWVDLVSATFTAVGAQRVTVAGTVDRYIRASFLFEGTGSGEAATAFIAFARN